MLSNLQRPTSLEKICQKWCFVAFTWKQFHKHFHIRNMCAVITLLELLPHLPEASELTYAEKVGFRDMMVDDSSP